MKKPLRHHLHDFFLPHERNELRPTLFGATSVAAIIVVVLVLELGVIAQVKFVFPSTSFLASVLPGALETLTNQSRTSAGVAVVTENPLLDQAAQLAASDMAAKGYFAHVSPSGTTPWDWLGEVGYRYSYAGENLAVNFSDSAALQQAWMQSPTHRANIVNPDYTQVGFGTAEGVYEGQQTTFVVEFFAAPALAAAPVAARPVAVDAKPEFVHAATTTAAILGAESSTTVATATPTAAPVAPVEVAARPAQGSLLDLILASPLTASAALLAALFALFAALVAASLVRHWRLPHPQVLAAGALLLAITFGLIAANPFLGGSVQLIPHDSLSASAIAALAQ